MKKIFLFVWLFSIYSSVFCQELLFFTNSDNSNYYDPSYLYSNSPSSLFKINTNKFPVSVDTFYSAPNSLKLKWNSITGGDWGAAIAAPGWLGRDITVMDTLSFWVLSTQVLTSSNLPLIYLEDLSNQKTDKINLSGYSSDIQAGIWTKIKVPISVFVQHPGSANLNNIKVVYFGQSNADGEEHTLFIDEVKMTGSPLPFEYKYIVVLGSSTAAGVGPTSPDSAWVNRFRKYITSIDTSYKVINLAVGGYTTYHAMPTGFMPPNGRPNPSVNNNITYALTYNPVAVLMNFPSNDAANSYPISEQINNYDTLTSILSNNNIKFWMSTTQPRNFSNQSQLNLLFAMRDSTYSRFSNYAVDFWMDIAQTSGWINSIYNSGDGIHLNNAAHRILFERMRDAVIPVLVNVEDKNTISSDLSYRLNNNYPNPFNPVTTISFHLQKKAMVKLDVLNVLGELVSNLISSEIENGDHSINFNAKGLPSGVYLCRLIVSDSINKNFVTTNKMVLVK